MDTQRQGTMSPPPARPKDRVLKLPVAIVAIVAALVVGFGLGYASHSEGSSDVQAATPSEATEAPSASEASEAPVVGETADEGSPSSEPEEVADTLGIGDEGQDGDIVFTLRSFGDVEQWEKSKYNGKPAEPIKGATLYAAEIGQLNDGAASYSPYCNGREGIRVVDAEGRIFDPMDNAYELKGNEEACEDLQPGFESNGVYLFQLPSTAKPVYVEMWDMGKNVNNYEGKTFVRYDAVG